MFKNALLVVCTALCINVAAQSRFTVSGVVLDSLNGEALIGATITVRELPATGAATNAYGFYSLTLPAGNYTLMIQFLGYEPFPLPVSLNANRRADVRLAQAASVLNEVSITADQEDQAIRQTEMGIQKLSIREVAKVPVIMGEKDILKTIQLLPGVKSSGEGSVGLHVRGGGADQNLLLLDEAPIYNASHLLNFFSIFNSDALKDVLLYKGSIPAAYGGRLSSVLDVKMNDGNNQDFNISGGLGLISSRLSVQGPLSKDKSSFIVSGRRSYADLKQ